MYKVIPTERFMKDVKYYVKKKGFGKISQDIKSVTDDQEVYLLTIYYKKDDNKIPSDTEIIQLVEEYCV